MYGRGVPKAVAGKKYLLRSDTERCYIYCDRMINARERHVIGKQKLSTKRGNRHHRVIRPNYILFRE